MAERVLGIGGVFFRSRDPQALARWYAEHLGIDIDASYGGASFTSTDGTFTVWSPFPSDTNYFGESGQNFMVNYRVADVDAIVAQLREAGVRVDDEVEDSESGRFAWAYDLDGNRFELWQPQ
jgi:catechol 2,3-dioxygenase-like lactoylglutathione lyase family enzyme